MIERCLDPNPRTRITVPQILAHEWFRTAPTVKSAEMAKRLRSFLVRSRFRRAVRRLQQVQFLQLRPAARVGAAQQLAPGVVADMRGAFFRATSGSMFATPAVFGRVLCEIMPAAAADELADTLFNLFDTDKDGHVECVDNPACRAAGTLACPPKSHSCVPPPGLTVTLASASPSFSLALRCCGETAATTP